MDVEDTRRLLRMEEEEEAEAQPRRRPMGFGRAEIDEDEGHRETGSPTATKLVESLIRQRATIIESTTFSARDKRLLLEENRKAITIVKGGRVAKTENVVYGILVFGGVLLITLSLLNTFAGLPTEITLSFVGTVLGGVIATIAQKLGRL